MSWNSAEYLLPLAHSLIRFDTPSPWILFSPHSLVRRSSLWFFTSAPSVYVSHRSISLSACTFIPFYSDDPWLLEAYMSILSDSYKHSYILQSLPVRYSRHVTFFREIAAVWWIHLLSFSSLLPSYQTILSFPFIFKGSLLRLFQPSFTKIFQTLCLAQVVILKKDIC